MSKSSSKFYNIILSIMLLITNCISSQIGNGYTAKSKIPVFTKPDRSSSIKFEIPQKTDFILLEKIDKKESKLSRDWWKIKKDNLVGFLEENTDSSYLIFLNLKNPKYGLVIATSLFLRSEPNADSKSIEKLQTKDIVEVVEDSNSSISVNGKLGFWLKVKTKSKNVGFVFSPYIMIGESAEYLASLVDFETKESGWVYIKNNPKFVYKLQNKKLVKIANEQVEENNFYLVKSRYVTSEGKIFFRVLKQNAKQEDWYSEREYTVIADCYLPAENVVMSNKYASLYAKIHSEDKKEIQIFKYLSKELNYDIDPQYSTLESFKSKKHKYHMIATTLKSEDDECIGCFLPESQNIVIVLKENGNLFESIFQSSGSRSAEIYSYDESPRIIIKDSPPPEGDESPSTIYTYEYGFKNEKFTLVQE